MSAPMERKQLQFVPFSSFQNSGFWHKLSKNKLGVYGLDESRHDMKGFWVDFTSSRSASKSVTSRRC